MSQSLLVKQRRTGTPSSGPAHREARGKKETAVRGWGARRPPGRSTEHRGFASLVRSVDAVVGSRETARESSKG